MRAMSLVRRFVLVAMTFCMTATGGICENMHPSTGHKGSLIKRDVLALYDSNDEPSPDQTRIHKFLEMPLKIGRAHV